MYVYIYIYIHMYVYVYIYIERERDIRRRRPRSPGRCSSSPPGGNRSSYKTAGCRRRYIYIYIYTHNYVFIYIYIYKSINSTIVISIVVSRVAILVQELAGDGRLIIIVSNSNYCSTVVLV